MIPYLFKPYLGILAVFLTLIGFIPYIYSILRGITKPHFFSWVIWGVATCVVFFAQLSDGAGAGSWAIGISSILTMMVAVLAYIKRSDLVITTTDWLFFVLALSALPFWYFTASPLWAVVVLTIVDTLGFFPTFRKAFRYPFEEQVLMYVIISFRNIVAILALEHYSLTTVLFPFTMVVVGFFLIGMIMIRRNVKVFL